MNERYLTEESIEYYRKEFPVTKNYIYLDHAGVAPISLRVKSAVEGFLKEASEAGIFKYQDWMDRLSVVRTNCAKLVGGEAEEVAFVKNTSHGLSIIAEGLDWKEGDNVIFFEREFPSNVYPWLNLRRKGVEIREIPSRGDSILVEDIERLMDLRTRLLTMSSVQFSNGFRIDLKSVGELCADKNVLFCVDAIQSLGVVPMDVRDFKVDFLSADGHKWLLAPEGTGIFYCRKELAEKINPPLVGWKSIVNESDYDRIDFRLKENTLRFEEGSLNVMGILALGASIELLMEVGIERIEGRVLELGDIIIREAEKRDFVVRTPRSRKGRAGIVSFSGNFDPLTLKDKLKSLDVVVNVRGGALRVSPHFYNTEEEISRLFDSIDKVLQSR